MRIFHFGVRLFTSTHPETSLKQKGEAISPRVRLFHFWVRLFTMGEAISHRVRLFTLRVRLFQHKVTSWASVGAKKFLRTSKTRLAQCNSAISLL